MRECERQGCEKVLPIDREKLLGSVAMVGHHPTLARPRERSKNEKARMPRRGAGAEQPNGKAVETGGPFHWASGRGPCKAAAAATSRSARASNPRRPE